MKADFNAFSVAQEQLDAAAELLGLDKATHELLRWPMHELKVTLFRCGWMTAAHRYFMHSG